MTRFHRALRSIQTMLVGSLQLFYAPRKARELFTHIYLFNPLPHSDRIRVVDLREVFPGIVSAQVQLRKCFLEYGNMAAGEVIAICLLVKWAKPRAIFEFGTFNGITTLQMALNAPADCTIATLNLPPDYKETVLPSSEIDRDLQPRFARPGTVFTQEPESGRIRELFGDSASFDFGPHLGKYDFVFIDACHEYDYAVLDTKTAMKLLGPNGGLVVWHDFPNAPGVRACLEEIARSHEISHIKGTNLAFAVVGNR